MWPFLLFFWSLWHLSFLQKQDALKAADLKFVFVDEVYSFSGKNKGLFAPGYWYSGQPADYEFIFIHLARPIYLTHVALLPNARNWVMFTNLGKRISPKGRFFALYSSPAIIVLVYRRKNPSTVEVLTQAGKRSLVLSEKTVALRQIYFLRHRKIYPVFYLRKPMAQKMLKFVDLTDSTAVGISGKYFFQIRFDRKFLKLIIAYRDKSKVRGTYFVFSNYAYQRTDVNFRIKYGQYFIFSPLGNVMYRIPDSALVRPWQLDTNIIVDLRYATKNNFTHRRLYPCAKCWLRYEVATDLVSAARDFEDLGYRLVMFDCYRPLHVQKLMWQAVPNVNYVAPPSKGSMHNRAVAVDVSLAYPNKHLVDMGTGFDYFGPEAWPQYRNLPKKTLYFRKLLAEIMLLHNFRGIKTEWWHFYHKSFNKYRPIDIDMCE